MNTKQKRVVKVLENMIALVKGDEDYAEMFSVPLESELSDIRAMDGFGTEGQCDPRGDQRDGDEYSMDYVEGIDDV